MTNRDYYGILNLFVLEKVGGVLMKYIGSELQDRMNLLGISVSALSEVTFMDEDLINGIISDRILAVTSCVCTCWIMWIVYAGILPALWT